MKLAHLTNKQLLLETKALSQQYRHVTTKLLHHIREIEKRRLFSDLGYSSLFDYVVRELGFSEPSASRRIKAARLLEEIPEIETKIEAGTINLSNLAKVSKLFQEEGIKDPIIKRRIIKKIENQSARQCDKLLNDLFTPNQEVFHNLKLLLTEEEFGKYETLKGLLAHHSGKNFWLRVFEAAIEVITQKKFKTTATRNTTSKDPRYVTARLKKAVFERDEVCQKCGGKYALEIDHRIPFALGGKTELQNLRLLCRSCNQRSRLRAALGSASGHRGRG